MEWTQDRPNTRACPCRSPRQEKATLFCLLRYRRGAPIGLGVVKHYRDAGVHQVLVGTIQRDPKTVQEDVERVAEKIIAPAAKV